MSNNQKKPAKTKPQAMPIGIKERFQTLIAEGGFSSIYENGVRM
ncbi:hypothetical protein [Allobaculum sp. Allo2]|nr:hypothetical protein [Allobaculum sp. Allo2]